MARVVVAMSGGVDSSVAAALAAEAGHETIGVTLKLLGGEPTGFGCCGSPRDVADAKRVAEALGIRHYVLNFDEVFAKTVIDPFVSDYLHSRTPNPCVECNRSVKFGTLSRLAEAWSADYVATGHYARVSHEDGRSRLLRAADEDKDQTYFLHSLTQAELRKTLFPIGHLRKAEVRAKARALGLLTADKEESQEICFVPNRDYRGFVRSRAGAEAGGPGEIQDSSGRRLGSHEGLLNYTIGQRKGLGLTSPRPMYVTGLDQATNTLVVGAEEETFRRGFVAGRVSWTNGAPRSSRFHARIRHRAALVPAAWGPQDAFRVRVDLIEPMRAVTPGQAAVFYDGEEVLGGGTIEEAL